MKILFISECYPSEEQSQYCIFLQQQAQALKKLGNDVRVLIPKKGSTNEVKHSIFNGIDVYRVWYSMSLFEKRILNTVDCPALNAFLIEKRFDIIAFQIVSDAIISTTVNICKGIQTKVVIHYHGLNIWKDYYPAHKLYEKLLIPQKVHLSNKVDAVICVSHSVEKVFRERNKRTPAYVVYNGVDLSRFAPNPNKCNSVFTVLCVANLIRIKGQEYLIKAIAELKEQGRNVRLQLIGDGSEKQRLMDLVASLNLQDDVAFLGTMPYDTVAHYMSNADMFILPSYFDASPCVCYEAMASGTLTCGCNVYGPSELISHMKTGLLVEPKSSRAIATIIQFAMDNPQRIQKIVNEGIRISKHRTWIESAYALDKAYYQIIG